MLQISNEMEIENWNNATNNLCADNNNLNSKRNNSDNNFESIDTEIANTFTKSNHRGSNSVHISNKSNQSNNVISDIDSQYFGQRKPKQRNAGSKNILSFSEFEAALPPIEPLRKLEKYEEIELDANNIYLKKKRTKLKMIDIIYWMTYVTTASIVIYIIYLFASVSYKDIVKRIEEERIAACAKLHFENKCDPALREPSMRSHCTAWETCMNRNPNSIRKYIVQHMFDSLADLIVALKHKKSYLMLR